MRAGAPLPAAALISGSGTNLQAVIDAVAARLLPLDLRLVLSNRAGAFGLERARRAGIRRVGAEIWNRAGGELRAAYDERLLRAVCASGAQLVLLLGWMHVLPASFIGAFEGVINIHPAYLPEDPQEDLVTLPDGSEIPAFRGANALREAIEAGVAWTGATCHVVTPQVDRGPVLAREAVRLEPGESQAAALERLHAVEHRVLVNGIARWCGARTPGFSTFSTH
ncbi:MAG: phosphoribosylglycinamide formyltransferase [bacterium]|nr:phosphoribosylglycinamide formyltransferase [bacterium]